jgi:hypothetical protein
MALSMTNYQKKNPSYQWTKKGIPVVSRHDKTYTSDRDNRDRLPHAPLMAQRNMPMNPDSTIRSVKRGDGS